MWLSTCHMCFIKAILEHFRARRRLSFGSPDIVWPVQSRTMVSVDQHGVVNFCESYVSWSWRRGQIDNFHNSALPLTFFLAILGNPERDFHRKTRFSAVCIQGDSSSPLEEASRWSILSEFFQRSGASFDTILENVSGWLPGSTPTIFGCACPSWPDGDARTLHVGYLHESARQVCPSSPIVAAVNLAFHAPP